MNKIKYNALSYFDFMRNLSSNFEKELSILMEDCPGAILPIENLLNKKLTYDLYVAKNLGITGRKLYCLFNDFCRRDLTLFLLNLRSLETGVYTDKEIEENFAYCTLDSYASYEQVRVTQPVPFLFFDQINPDAYLNDSNFDNPNDPYFKEYVAKNRDYHIISKFLLLSECFCETNLKIKQITDKEIVVEGVIPVISKSSTTYSVNRSFIKEITSKNKQKYFDEISDYDFKKIWYWLAKSKNNFIPSLAVIRNLPIEQYDYFWTNNNYQKFANLVKLVNAKSLEEKSDLIRCCSVLGLFSQLGTQSQKAYDFISSEFSGGKNKATLHEYFNYISDESFNKDFADFFMMHFPQNPNCFENYFHQIHSNFEKILSFRKEKEIRTTTKNKLLTPQDAIAAVSDIRCIYGYHDLPDDKQEVLKRLTQFSNNEAEIKWSMDILSKNVDCNIPYLKGGDQKLLYYTLQKGDPEFCFCGKKTNCCFRWEGVAFSSLIHAITDPDSTVVVFASNQTYLQGWIWYDKSQKLLCIDNLEGLIYTDENGSYNTFSNVLLEFADEMYKTMNKNGNPVEFVTLGTHVTDYKERKVVENLIKLNMAQVYVNPNRIKYPIEHKLYTDAQDQWILSSKELLNIHEKSRENLDFQK